jgi:uncharacterized protein (TIGR03083 family)
MDIWPVIHTERKALADDLRGLDDSQWAAPSWCDGWTVRDALAHMTATAKITPAAFFTKLAGNGFSFARLQAKDIAVERGTTPADALARFEVEVNSSTHPPGPNGSWISEAIIHSQDIRGALGIAHEYPTDAVVEVADFYKGSNLLVGAKKRIDGLSLTATDAQWSHGTGPEVSGPILALVMAMTGRKQVMDQLSGDGVEVLRARP